MNIIQSSVKLQFYLILNEKRPNCEAFLIVSNRTNCFVLVGVFFVVLVCFGVLFCFFIFFNFSFLYSFLSFFLFHFFFFSRFHFSCFHFSRFHLKQFFSSKSISIIIFSEIIHYYYNIYAHIHTRHKYKNT